MAGKPQERPEIRKERARRADGGEPLDTSDEMSIRWQGNSLVIGLTNYAVRTHDITADDVACVETYMDGIWIDLGGGGDEQ
jgi:hypothetical protein